MDTLVVIATVYAAAGVISTGVVMLTEILLSMARGPEYLLWLHKQGGRGLTARNYIIGVVIWPLVVGLWMLAVWHKRTLNEEMSHISELMDKAKAKRDLQMKANWPPKWKRWVTSVQGGMRLHVLTMQLPRGEMVITHAVTPAPQGGGLFICWRAAHLPRYNIPVSTTDDLKKAKDYCEKDTEWIDLFHPERTGDRFRKLAAMWEQVKAEAKPSTARS